VDRRRWQRGPSPSRVHVPSVDRGRGAFRVANLVCRLPVWFGCTLGVASASRPCCPPAWTGRRTGHRACMRVWQNVWRSVLPPSVLGTWPGRARLSRLSRRGRARNLPHSVAYRGVGTGHTYVEGEAPACLWLLRAQQIPSRPRHRPVLEGGAGGATAGGPYRWRAHKYVCIVYVFGPLSKA